MADEAGVGEGTGVELGSTGADVRVGTGVAASATGEPDSSLGVGPQATPTRSPRLIARQMIALTTALTTPALALARLKEYVFVLFTLTPALSLKGEGAAG